MGRPVTMTEGIQQVWRLGAASTPAPEDSVRRGHVSSLTFCSPVEGGVEGAMGRGQLLRVPRKQRGEHVDLEDHLVELSFSQWRTVKSDYGVTLSLELQGKGIFHSTTLSPSLLIFLFLNTLKIVYVCDT